MSPDRVASPAPVTHLAILVVYALRHDDDLPLLRLHLDRIARHTRVPYTIYAVARRVSDAARAEVAAAPRVEMCDVPEAVVDGRALSGSREHACYLDAMLPIALSGPASHVCTLDVDSFPVRDDWIETIERLAPPESGFVGVLRLENRDPFLPHPSCIVASREFFERFRPSFSPIPEPTDAARAFHRATHQRPDTGIRIAALLWQEQLPWGQLARTNVNDPHYLMAGLYGDIIFHLGGISRGKLFHTDLAESVAHRVSQPLVRLPIRTGPLGRARAALVHRIRRGAEARLAAQNRTAYMHARTMLLADSDGLFSYLRGTGPAPEAKPSEASAPTCPTPPTPAAPVAS